MLYSYSLILVSDSFLVMFRGTRFVLLANSVYVSGPRTVLNLMETFFLVWFSLTGLLQEPKLSYPSSFYCLCCASVWYVLMRLEAAVWAVVHLPFCQAELWWTRIWPLGDATINSFQWSHVMTLWPIHLVICKLFRWIIWVIIFSVVSICTGRMICLYSWLNIPRFGAVAQIK